MIKDRTLLKGSFRQEGAAVVDENNHVFFMIDVEYDVGYTLWISYKHCRQGALYYCL